MMRTSCYVLLAVWVGLLSEEAAAASRAPYASTYEPRPTEEVLIRGATVLTGSGARLDGTDVHISGGRIAAVGTNLPIDNATTVDGSGRWLTPGIIDVHSHLGNYPAPGVASTADGNEMTGPDQSRVWAEHSVWPQDPQFPLALAGGVTTPADPAGQRQPLRRARRDAEERAVPDGAGDEVSGRQAIAEDGLRREKKRKKKK